MRREWILHLGLSPEFPRDVFFMSPDARRDALRFPVANAQEYMRAVNDNINSRGSFVNVYSKRQQQASVIDKLFFDLDAEALDVAFRKRKEAHRFFDKLEWGFRENFSANKGFQFFVDLPQEVLVDWDELKAFYQRLNSNAGGIFDEAVWDKNRVCRIPWTPNLKGLRHGRGMLWCVPIERDWDLERILQAASMKAPPAELELGWSENAMRDIDALPKTGARPFESHKQNQVITVFPLSAEQREYYEGLVNTIITLVAPHIACDHGDGRKAVMHFLLIPSLVQLGYSDSQIHETCKRFIEHSKQVYGRSSYAVYVEQSIARNRSGAWKPQPLDKFMASHPGVFP